MLAAAVNLLARSVSACADWPDEDDAKLVNWLAASVITSLNLVGSLCSRSFSSLISLPILEKPVVLEEVESSLPVVESTSLLDVSDDTSLRLYSDDKLLREELEYKLETDMNLLPIAPFWYFCAARESRPDQYRYRVKPSENLECF